MVWLMEQLFGSDLTDWAGEELPETIQPLEALVLVKGMQTNGEMCWSTLTTDNLSRMEALGMVTEQQRALLDWASNERWDGSEDGD